MAGDRAQDGPAEDGRAEDERPESAVPSGVIAVVRAATAGEARTIVHGLVRAAVPAVELTLTVPEALTILAEAARAVARPGSVTVLGAGTVLDRRACEEAIAAGARFVVSPVTDPPVLEQAHRGGVPYVGGALTPTEALASMRAGVDAVKLFPVGSVGGPAYLRALREPLPGLRAVVSGGIGAGEVRDYVAAGAHAVCLGGALIDRAAAQRGDVGAVAAWARQALAQISEDTAPMPHPPRR
jgi:2-dehydro-3-deoxyphosphogluconate aldolase / (4S)-4-hydroxy-2-oxoglutarate aldolase